VFSHEKSQKGTRIRIDDEKGKEGRRRREKKKKLAPSNGGAGMKICE
jgi:hypothetical protein